MREQIPDNIIAASLAFDHFARELTRPENGGHYRLVSAYNDPTLRSSTDADGYGGTDLVVIPTGATGYPLGTCTPLEIWANHYAVDLENYKSVPDYLWEVMKAYSIATPAQLGVY